MIARMFGKSQSAFRSDENTIETPQSYLLQAGQQSSLITCCATCGEGFRLVTAFTAAAVANVNCQTIYRWAETGEIHFSVTDEGSLLICLDSLYEREDCNNTRYQATEQLLVTLFA